MYTSPYPIPMTPFDIFHLIGLILAIAGFGGFCVNAWKDKEQMAALCLVMCLLGGLMLSVVKIG